MARINIEECWWTDPRRSKLIKLMGGDEERADGAAVRMWRLAQEFWKCDRRSVPQPIFKTLEHAELLLGAGLASLGEVLGDGLVKEVVYVRGSSQWLDWAREQKEKNKANGSKGGKKSATRPRNAKGQLLKKSAKVQAPAKRKPSQPKPSDSDSVSVSKKREEHPLPEIVNLNPINPVRVQEASFNKPELDSMRSALSEVFGSEKEIPRLLVRQLPALLVFFETADSFKQGLTDVWNEAPANDSNPSWRTYIEGRLLKIIRPQAKVSS